MLKRLILGVIGFYRVTFAAVFGGRCRFYPSCSAYAAEAVRRHGVVKGGLLAAGRLARCGPQHEIVPLLLRPWLNKCLMSGRGIDLGLGHGFDPVPEVWHCWPSCSANRTHGCACHADTPATPRARKGSR